MASANKKRQETGATLYLVVQDIREVQQKVAAATTVSTEAGAPAAPELTGQSIIETFDRWIAALSTTAPYLAFVDDAPSYKELFGRLNGAPPARRAPRGRSALGLIRTIVTKSIGAGLLFMASLALMALVFLHHRAAIGDSLLHVLSLLSGGRDVRLGATIDAIASNPRTLLGLVLVGLFLLNLVAWLSIARLAASKIRLWVGFAAAVIAGVMLGILLGGAV